MIKISTEEFAKELKALDSRFEIIKNPNREGLSNIKLGGVDLSPLPSEELQDEHSPSYKYLFPNGMKVNHRTSTELRVLAKTTIEKLKNEEFAANFFFKD